MCDLFDNPSASSTPTRIARKFHHRALAVPDNRSFECEGIFVDLEEDNDHLILINNLAVRQRQVVSMVCSKELHVYELQAPVGIKLVESSLRPSRSRTGQINQTSLFTICLSVAVIK